MALFKIFRGESNQLNLVPKTQGYAYFTEDTHKLYIDLSSDKGSTKGVRVAVEAEMADEAKIADALKRSDGTTLDVDDIFLKNLTASVTQGGTGRNTLTTNALLIGNGTNTIKMVALTNGNIAIGDSTNGIRGLSGTGALYSTTANAPQFGTLPATIGGTGRGTLTINALLAGNGPDPVKQISLPNGNVLVGDSTNVIRGVSGTGALYSTTSGQPRFGTLPISAGGTGATGSTTARSNLGVYGKGEVYTKTEADAEIKKATSTCSVLNLNNTGWKWDASTKTATYSISVPTLTCGKNGDVPPLISCLTNKLDYNKITSAQANPDTKMIVFNMVLSAETDKPKKNIQINVIDIK